MADLNLNNARAFVAHLQGREIRYEDHPYIPVQEGGLSPHTIHGYVRAIKAFGAWLEEENYAQSNPYTRLKRPKLPQTMIKVLSPGEIKAVVESINEKCVRGSRLKVIVLLLLDTGIRANELLGISLDNMDLERNAVKVMGKGRKEREVLFSDATKRTIIRYLIEYRPSSDCPYLILAEDGTRLGYDALAHIIKRLGEKSGIPRLHAHLFRHTFAVRYLLNGGDLITLRNILGHTSVEVTQQYLHLTESHVQTQYQKYSPVASLGIR